MRSPRLKTAMVNWWQANALRVANELRRHEYTSEGLAIQHKRFTDEEQKRAATLKRLRSRKVGRSAKDMMLLELEQAVDLDPRASRSTIDADMALQHIAELEQQRAAAPKSEDKSVTLARNDKIRAEKLKYCNAIKDVRSVRNALRHPERTPSTLQHMRKVAGIFSAIAVSRERARRSSKADMLANELEGPVREFDHYAEKKSHFRVALFAGALLAKVRKPGVEIRVAPETQAAARRGMTMNGAGRKEKPNGGKITTAPAQVSPRQQAWG